MSAQVRPAEPADVTILVEMVRELADYERSLDQVETTAGALSEALFGAHPAAFAHVGLDAAGDVAGFALWFLNFSTWKARHGIYLEDLYVRPAARGTGLGVALLQTLAALCVERGYRRLEWWVLDWNNPAHDFYAAAGAVPMDDWTVWRLSDDGLAGFAARAGRLGPGGAQRRAHARQRCRDSSR